MPHFFVFRFLSAAGRTSRPDVASVTNHSDAGKMKDWIQKIRLAKKGGVQVWYMHSLQFIIILRMMGILTYHI